MDNNLSTIKYGLENYWYSWPAWNRYLDWLKQNNFINTLFQEARFLSELPPLDILTLQKLSTIVTDENKAELLTQEAKGRKTLMWESCKEIVGLFKRYQFNRMTSDHYNELLYLILPLMDDITYRFWTYVTLSRLHFITGDYETSLSFSGLILKKYPDYPDAWYLMAMIHESFGNEKEALNSWNHYYQLRPFFNDNRVVLKTEQLYVIEENPDINDKSIILLARKHPDNAIVLRTNEPLNIECTRCGECCKGSIPVLENEVKEIEVLAGISANVFAYMDHEGHWRFRTQNNNYCFWFSEEDKRCKIYFLRPTVCRDYPVQKIIFNHKEYSVVELCSGVKTSFLDLKKVHNVAYNYTS